MTSAALHTPLPVPPHPSPASCTCVLGETGKGHLIVGESSQLGKEFTGLQRAASGVRACWWLVIAAGRGGAGWGRSALKETEEVNLWCHRKAALQGKPITYPASWRLQGRAPWGETKERWGRQQWKDLGCSFSVQVSTNLVMSSRAGWKETALQSTRTSVHFVCLSFV